MKAYSCILLYSILTINILSANAADKTRTFKASQGGTLSVEVNSGEIRITTWEKNEVKVIVRGLYDEDTGDLQFSNDQNGVQIKFLGGWSDPDELIFIVNTPVRYNQDVRTSAGDIFMVGNFKGTINAITQGGDIRIGNVDGKTELNTMGGDITAGAINGDAEISSAGGDITLGNITGNADISTMGGDITTADISKKVKIRTQGGDIKIGKTGGDTELYTLGGDILARYITGNCRLDTHGGDIQVNGAKGTVNAKTLGGDLKLMDINGSLAVSTASGDIMVELFPDKNNSTIVTQNGGIIFRIPDNAQAEITANVRLIGSHNHNDNEESGIVSDFKAASHQQNNNGIKNVYLLNGGGAVIQLESNNSGIKIIKLQR